MSGDSNKSTGVVLKSGLWYTVSSFAFRAVAFVTAPIFARLLTKAEYGDYTNITSWISILFFITGCDLYTSIIRAKLDYENDLEHYGSSMLALEEIITLGWACLFFIFRKPLANLMSIDAKYFPVIFLYLFFIMGFYVYITMERARYRYKTFSILTGVGIIASCAISLLWVIGMPQDRLTARVYGQYIPYVAIGIILTILVFRKGWPIKKEYWKYGLMLSLPLVPHLLSMTVLSSSDRIMIKRFIGAEEAAVYGIAYLIATILSILIDSMNKAWAPWVLDSIKAKSTEAIGKVSKFYVAVFLAVIVGTILAAPELILILGGSKYTEAVYVLPPLIAGCVFQFLYTMYVQIEFYEKRMKIVAIGTTIAAVVNIILNLIFIPKYGYIAAGYTTLVGYAVLYIIHYFMISKLGYKNLYDRRIIIAGIILSLALIPIGLALVGVPIIRRVLLIAYIIAFITVLIMNKNRILGFLKGRK